MKEIKCSRKEYHLKKLFCTLSALFLILAIPLDNTAFATDLIEDEANEPNYLEIIEEIFPGFQNEQAGQVSPQWTSGAPDAANPKTHGYITQVAYDLIRDDNIAANYFYTGKLTKLVRGSVLPDADETAYAFAWHFYGENGKNYLGGSTTAYSKCIEHYNSAVSLYTSGSTSDAMEELGRALHYLQDVNVPHHAKNAIAGLTNHSQFEKLAEENMESYAVSGLTNSIYTDADNSLGTIIDYYADIARGWYAKASSGDNSQMLTAAGACVRNSQRATVTVLYKFMFDVGYLVNVR